MNVAVNLSLVIHQTFESWKCQIAFEAISRTMEQLPVLLQVSGHLLAAHAAVDGGADVGFAVHLADVDVASVQVRKNFSAVFERTSQLICWTSPTTRK
jgi:hypothetical protein